MASVAWRVPVVNRHARRQVRYLVSQSGRRYAREPAHEPTPERLYARRRALTLLEGALAALAAEYAAAGRSALFDGLRPALAGDPDARPYAALARDLGTTEGALKMAAQRLRRRYRERLLSAIARTVADPADAADEVRALFEAPARSPPGRRPPPGHHASILGHRADSA